MQNITDNVFHPEECGVRENEAIGDNLAILESIANNAQCPSTHYTY